MSATIDVVVGRADGGWTAGVRVGDDSASTEHIVQVGRAYAERIAPGVSPEDLVRASFAFLLEREPKESILREFDLSIIARYFPEYEEAIGALLRDEGGGPVQRAKEGG